MRNLKKYLLICIILTWIAFSNFLVNSSYEKPVAPSELSSEIISGINLLLDKEKNKKSDLTKYPTEQKYIDYLDRVNIGLNKLKLTFNSSDSRYIIISYFSSWITNIKNSVQNSSNLLESLSNIINDETWYSSNNPTIVTNTWTTSTTNSTWILGYPVAPNNAKLLCKAIFNNEKYTVVENLKIEIKAGDLPFKFLNMGSLPNGTKAPNTTLFSWNGYYILEGW